MATYTRFVERVLAEAREQGAELKYWSPWNEPNHPYFISPQRMECDRDAPSAAVGPYVEMARALKAGVDAAPGEQSSSAACWRPRSEAADETSVSEFVADIPADMLAARRSGRSTVTSQQRPSTTSSARWRAGLKSRKNWITETGAGAPRSGEERRASRPSQVRAAVACTSGCASGNADPRVSVAFQYRSREASCSRRAGVD